VGGLESVKEELLTTFKYPTKYSIIFKNSPIQLSTGIHSPLFFILQYKPNTYFVGFHVLTENVGVLVYGAPGTGKSMLSKCVESLGLQTITVECPSILNKYIGESERNVRDLFQKAQNMKPSVIIFEEFESIARRRGSGSTGVTDRIVNMLLCTMDGVGAREDVYIFAISSRPDLIDPALLRPGRIDKLLYCGFPDGNERKEILKQVTKKFSFQIEENLEQYLETLAEQCEYFTGADFEGLLQNAYMIAFHQLLDGKTQDSDQIFPEYRGKSKIHSKLRKR
jgi:peroxin-1